MQHLYETAIFWGDKVLTWTGQILPTVSSDRIIGLTYPSQPTLMMHSGWPKRIFFVTTTFVLKVF